MVSESENYAITEQVVSARILAEQIYLSGDLSGVSFSSVSGQEGTRLHRKVFDDIRKEYESKHVETEVSLSAVFESNGFILKVSGRADCLISENNDSDDPGLMSLIEIKSHNRQNATYDQLFRPVHRAQLVLYAHMLMSGHPNVSAIEIILRYVSIQTLKPIGQSETISRSDAKVFFDNTCSQYKALALQLIDDRSKRNESIRHLSFPYGGLRDGQRTLMEHVIGSIRCKQTLFAEAPTGIGKTIGVLFPSLKCLSRGFSERIFYLTAKISTREIARKTLNDLRANGLYARSIVLSSKETMCPNKALYCEPKACPLALGYYDRLKGAVNDLMNIADIHPSIVIQAAQKYRLCPFELSLDISLFCDVIIGDYNHAFHPRIRLERFFDDPAQSHIILNDESHNLVDRSREMFSAPLNFKTFHEFSVVSRGMTREIDALSDSISRYFSTAYESISRGEMAFDRIERDFSDEHVHIAQDFRAVKLIPKTLYGDLWRICYRLSEILDSIPVGPIRKSILDFFFEARYFLTVSEQFFNSSYVFIAKVDRASADRSGCPYSMLFSLSCLDASDFLYAQIKDRHPCVFFSATLSPSLYYRSMLVGTAPSGVEEINIPSPFPKENLEVCFHTDIRTVYRERYATADAVIRCIREYTKRNCGNYIAYFPSFQYMEMVRDRFCDDSEAQSDTEIIVQQKDMNSMEKEAFLTRFDRFGEKTLLGFAILGGHFGEGIDLVGERLSGVFIVGVGIPQISPEREILRQYFQEKFGDGYSFAYRYPGWEKVLQACGRVIRDESDCGFVVLMDHRYALIEYRSLFPKHWQTDLALKTENDVEDAPFY